MTPEAKRILGGSHWPRPLALAVAQRFEAFELAIAKLRQLDQFLQLAGKASAVPVFSEAHWGRARSLTQADQLVAINPALAVPARPVLKALRAKRWRRSQDEKAPTPPVSRRRLSVPPCDWPEPWRDTLARLWRRSADSAKNVVSLEVHGVTYTAKSLQVIEQTVAQLVHQLRHAQLPVAELSLEAVDVFLGGLLSRDRRPATVAARLKDVTAWGRAVGVEEATLAYLRQVTAAFRLQADRSRKRKEELLLDLDLRLGEIFLRAQDLHDQATAQPPNRTPRPGGACAWTRR